MSSPENEFRQLSLRARMPPGRSEVGQFAERSDSEANSNSDARREREIYALDILSTFHQDTLPSSFRTDEQSTISTLRSPNACMVQLDLEATVLRLAVNVPSFFSVLRAVQPPASCAEIFFQKIRRKAMKTFQDWDIYCRYGPHGSQLRQTRALSASVPTHPLTIDWLVHTFRTTTRLVSRQIRYHRPYGSQAAAECILYILGETILHRNRDAFTGSHWGRQIPPDEAATDPNVYYQLIVAARAQSGNGSASSSSDSESDSDEDGGIDNQEKYYFGLSALESLPIHIVRERLQQLSFIRENLDRFRAPLAYRRRFYRIIEKARGSPQPPQGGLKRSTPGNGDEAAGSSSSIQRGVGGRRYR